jgi:outer membrane scaffolding protein for murein synthesis (MipA/OmpV family)
VRAALRPVFVAMTLLPAAAAAKEEPLWEAGFGVAAIHFPYYRGSAQERTYALPAPYFVYRGDIFKADRYGMRGVFFKTERMDLNMSFGASLPVESEDIPVREGMPSLEPSVEIGPSLDVTLWRSAGEGARLDIRTPLRAAITVESSPRYIGAQFYPHANLDFSDAFGIPGWNLGVQAGPVFTNSRYNRYYYGVPDEFARPSRPAYDPQGGYAGVQFLTSLSKRFPRYWVGAFVRYDTLSGAEFETSPLVTSKRYFAAGFGISWIFAESSTRVATPDVGKAR